MGQQIKICCNYKDKDEHGQEFADGSQPKNISGGNKRYPQPHQFASKALLLECRKKEANFIKVQACFRGFLYRKRMKLLDHNDAPKLSNRSSRRRKGMLPHS